MSVFDSLTSALKDLDIKIRDFECRRTVFLNSIVNSIIYQYLNCVVNNILSIDKIKHHDTQIYIKNTFASKDFLVNLNYDENKAKNLNVYNFDIVDNVRNILQNNMGLDFIDLSIDDDNAFCIKPNNKVTTINIHKLLDGIDEIKKTNQWLEEYYNGQY